MARHVELTDFDFFQGAVLDFPIDAHARNNGDAEPHLDDALDALDGGHFERHVEGGAMFGEKFDHAATEGGFNDVGDKTFLAQFLNVYFAALGESVLWRNYEGEFVFQDFSG
jgi:hypothetical protein